MRWTVGMLCVAGAIWLAGCATAEIYVIALSPGGRVRVTDEDSFRDELLRTVPGAQHSMGLAVDEEANTGWLLARNEAEKDRLKTELESSGAWHILEVECMPKRDLSRFLDAKTERPPAETGRE